MILKEEKKMKKRTMLVAGLGAAGALFLSVNAWTASAAPASTPAPDRYMQFIDENDNGVCDNKENGTYVQQPNYVKEGNADGNGICRWCDQHHAHHQGHRYQGRHH